MMPKFRINRKIRPARISRLEMPPTRILTHDRGELVDNVDYTDLRWVDWKVFEINYDFDLGEVQHADQVSKNKVEFEKAMCQGDNNAADIGDYRYINLETGVNSIACALAAFGCVPFSSCRGHYWNKGTHPNIVFWSCKRQARKVLDLKPKDVYIINCHPEGYQGLMAYSASIMSLINFSRIIADSAR